MKIVLLKSTAGLGQTGEIKDVKDGYALNYLIPRGLASQATKQGINVIAAQKRRQHRLKQEAVSQKLKLAKKINGQTFIIKVKADDQGTAYAQINSKLIADFLEQSGYNINEGEIILPQPLKKIGEYQLELILAGAKALVNLNIIRDK